MDLTTGCPLWPIRDGLLATYPPLTRDITCDVAITASLLSSSGEKTR